MSAMVSVVTTMGKLFTLMLRLVGLVSELGLLVAMQLLQGFLNILYNNVSRFGRFMEKIHLNAKNHADPSVERAILRNGHCFKNVIDF